MEPDYAQNAAFHDRLAAEYDRRLTRNPHDALARQAFRDLVTRYVPSGGVLLDFGCGTGLDAHYYARRGYRVLAYDSSAGMVSQLARRCAAEVAAGQVHACSFEYAAFPGGLPPWPAPQAIAMNFAVLNSVRDLEPLFGRFRELLQPGGWLMMSVLNPLHWSKVKMPAWWRNILPHPTAPRLYMTEPYASYLHFVPALLRAAHGFHLVGRAQAGAMVRYDEVGRHGPSSWWTPDGMGWQRCLWRTPIYKLLGHFVFLVLRRNP